MTFAKKCLHILLYITKFVYLHFILTAHTLCLLTWMHAFENLSDNNLQIYLIFSLKFNKLIIFFNTCVKTLNVIYFGTKGVLSFSLFIFSPSMKNTLINIISKIISLYLFFFYFYLLKKFFFPLHLLFLLFFILCLTPRSLYLDPFLPRVNYPCLPN